MDTTFTRNAVLLLIVKNLDLNYTYYCYECVINYPKSESKYIIFDDERLTAYIVWGTFDVKKAS